ncbi:MAG: exodeoxyribonuclease VII large subunit [Fervidobacterium sp.]|uniref:exodeoxyribonuclease VII large subunit n=1 Tax=Fervidobacterium sp. TaxID=1871331 RepID=UPI00404AEC72
MENLRQSDLLDFPTLREFVEYIHTKLKATDILNQRYKFSADVVKVKPYNGSLYITVSQESPGNKKTELTVYVWQGVASSILKYLAAFGVKSIYDLEHKKWEFQGKLSFYPDRFQFSFWADSIAPQGESDILKRRQKIKEDLLKQGLLMQEVHNLSELEPIKLIAVVTSRTAQGYFDFLSNLLVPDAYKPVIHLYESSMQGVSTAQEVTAALNRIVEFCSVSNKKYDVVVIIRGGGGPSDLMYFDDYELAVRIAQMNDFIPVLTGIGHEKDETVIDYVAWRRFPTPTAVAKEISQQIKNYLDEIEDGYKDIQQSILNIVKMTENDLQSNTYNMLRDTLKGNILKNLKNIVDSAKSFTKLINVESLEKKISFEFTKSVSRSLSLKLTEMSQDIKDSSEFVDSNFSLKLRDATAKMELNGILSASLDRIYSLSMDKLQSLKAEIDKIAGPMVVLSMGGALITKDGELVKSKKETKPGETLRINFIDGNVDTKVI